MVPSQQSRGESLEKQFVCHKEIFRVFRLDPTLRGECQSGGRDQCKIHRTNSGFGLLWLPTGERERKREITDSGEGTNSPWFEKFLSQPPHANKIGARDNSFRLRQSSPPKQKRRGYRSPLLFVQFGIEIVPLLPLSSNVLGPTEGFLGQREMRSEERSQRR
jgi:hypothetical protein